jgi:UDP-N-acetylglucosamine 4,6-dehydratase
LFDGWFIVREFKNLMWTLPDILAAPSRKTIYDLNTQCWICNMQHARTWKNLRYTTWQSIRRNYEKHSNEASSEAKRPERYTVGRGTSMNWSEQEVLVTGGTGSFGRKFIEIMLREYHPRRLVILSRDELKQHDMRSSGFDHASLRYFLGDVRDASRLHRAFSGISVVVHAAALKQVPACEYNPFEAIQTNIMGGRNVIDAAIDRGVQRVLALSTDKAVNPVNLYGATKLCAEKVFVQANSYAGSQETRFSCARYGNVVGSRGSVIPVFLEQRKRGRITITDARMTRFWLTLDQGVRFVIRSIEQMHGGEIFVPKIPSMRLVDLAEAVAPGCTVEFIGIRPGEKLHEVLLSEDEARSAVEVDDMYIIQPSHPWWKRGNWIHARELPQGFRYTSDTNEQWLTNEQMQELLDLRAAAQSPVAV